MMENMETQESLIELMESSLLSTINEQTLFHLLMDKGILTREEIAEKKKYIAKQYTNEQKVIEYMKAQLEDQKKFDTEFSRILKGDKNADRDYLLSKLDEMKSHR